MTKGTSPARYSGFAIAHQNDGSILLVLADEAHNEVALHMPPQDAAELSVGLLNGLKDAGEILPRPSGTPTILPHWIAEPDEIAFSRPREGGQKTPALVFRFGPFAAVGFALNLQVLDAVLSDLRARLSGS